MHLCFIIKMYFNIVFICCREGNIDDSANIKFLKIRPLILKNEAGRK